VSNAVSVLLSKLDRAVHRAIDPAHANGWNGANGAVAQDVG
ncbi:hypothetical protein Y032_1429g3872, partial [Ancylostoma ceylanicum]